jgi:hypothetical protein
VLRAIKWRQELISSGNETIALGQAGFARRRLGSALVSTLSLNRDGPDAKLLSAIVPVDCSIAIDPIKYIGVPSSFDDFEPDSNIIDNDRMPGKPSPPAGSVFGSHSHFMIPSFGSRMTRKIKL